jgi:SAM-dependent methyltransferase
MLTDEIYVADLLLSIYNQSINKSDIHLFADISKIGAKGSEVFHNFMAEHRSEYKSVIVNDQPTIGVRQRSIRYCETNLTDYFWIDQNVIIHPNTLRRLHDLNLEVVAPMLVYDGLFSNFHAYVDDGGYYKSGDNYQKIVRRELNGVINVPVVNSCYLIRNECLKYVEYDDHSGRLEYVIFSDVLRKKGIPQYIDNTRNYGIMLNYRDKTEREIRDVDATNNKKFYLAINDRHKRGIICDADWLSGFVVGEHLYLMRLLQDNFNFHIVNCNKLDIKNAGFVEDLNSYDALLTAYHVYSKIPLDRVTSYKIYKIDDMENDPEYSKIVNFNINHSNMIVSPYAYVFDKYYKHDNVVWVPYSCALESYEEWQSIKFNENPKVKVLQSGHVAWSYPFRQYVASLNHEGLEKLPHQGWRRENRGEAAEQIIGLKYYKKLNEYLCCFTDALTFRYIVLKNFEIAAIGSLLLTDKIVEQEMNELGFVDYETCIFSDQETFLDKVNWILDPHNREEVDVIRRAGMELVRQRHLTRHRAKQFNDIVTDALRRDESQLAAASGAEFKVNHFTKRSSTLDALTQDHDVRPDSLKGSSCIVRLIENNEMNAFVARETNRALRDEASVQYARAATLGENLPIHPDPPKVWDNFLALFHTLKTTNPAIPVLDAGAAPYSAYLPGLRSLGFSDLTGINLEISETQIINGVRYQHGDITKTPFPDRSFGFIACLSVIEHSVDCKLFLKEMARIIRNGGYIFISFDYWEQPVDTTGILMCGAAWKIFCRQDVEELIGEAYREGFELVGTPDIASPKALVECASRNYTFCNLLLQKKAVRPRTRRIAR